MSEAKPSMDMNGKSPWTHQLRNCLLPPHLMSVRDGCRVPVRVRYKSKIHMGPEQ